MSVDDIFIESLVFLLLFRMSQTQGHIIFVSSQIASHQHKVISSLLHFCITYALVALLHDFVHFALF